MATHYRLSNPRSLSRVLTVLGAALLTIAATGPAAEPDDQQPQNPPADAPVKRFTEEVTIVAPPIVESDRVTSFATQITSISARQVDDLGAGELANALRRMPGVTISRYGLVGPYGGGALDRAASLVEHGVNAVWFHGFDERAFAACDRPPDDATLDMRYLEMIDFYGDNLTVLTKLYPHAAETIEALAEAGKAVAVVTNKPHRFTVPVMQGLKLMSRSATVISSDTPANAKPHPLPLLTACEQIGVPPARVLYVGDDLRDIHSAQAAHMPSAAAGWGYIGNSGEIETWGASVIAAQPLDLLLHLGR